MRSYDLRMGRMTEDLVGSPVFCVSDSKVSSTSSTMGSSTTYLTSSADGKVRVWDRSDGSVLQCIDYVDGDEAVGAGKGTGVEKGSGAGRVRVNTRVRAEWGYGDETILVGGEDGRVGAWEVLSVRPCLFSTFPLCHFYLSLSLLSDHLLLGKSGTSSRARARNSPCIRQNQNTAKPSHGSK